MPTDPAGHASGYHKLQKSPVFLGAGAFSEERQGPRQLSGKAGNFRRLQGVLHDAALFNSYRLSGQLHQNCDSDLFLHRDLVEINVPQAPCQSVVPRFFYDHLNNYQDAVMISVKVLHQESYFCTVNRARSGEIKSETRYLGPDMEASSQLVIDIPSYTINEASWEICRSPGDNFNGWGFLPELKGVGAHFGAGKHLKFLADKGESGELIKELVAECIRGAIQAETYLFKERGFPTEEDYEQHWSKVFGVSCRYCCFHDRTERSWFEYIGDYKRKHFLFNRNKTVIISRQDDGSISAAGAFIDSFHELSIRLVFDEKNGKIISAGGNFLRAPDKVCFENESHLLLLTGNSVFDLRKKEVAAVAGGKEGCFHLVDIVTDVLNAVRKVLK